MKGCIEENNYSCLFQNGGVKPNASKDSIEESSEVDFLKKKIITTLHDGKSEQIDPGFVIFYQQ